MSGLTRYILRQTFIVTLVMAAVLTAAVWLAQSLRLIDLIVNRGLSIGLFLHLALLILPSFIDAVLPIALFIAILYVYNRLIADSELVVMRAAGVSPWAIARPAMLAGVTALVILISMSVYFMPAANRAFRDLEFEISHKLASVLLLEGAFNQISGDVTIYVRARDSAGDLSGIVIYDGRDKAKPVMIVAERGAVVNTAKGPRLLLVKGSRQTRDRKNGHLSVLSFDQYTLDLDHFHAASGIRNRRPEELYIDELLRPQPGETAARRQARLIELNLRLIDPLMALAMAAIPLACLLVGDFNRRGQTWRVLLAVVLGFLVEAADVGFKNLAARDLAAIVLLYINVLTPPVITAWLLTRGEQVVVGRRAAA